MAPAMTEARRNMVAQNMTDPNVTKLFYNGRECAEVETKVTGKVPQWISGCMNRNGPGIFDIGDDTYGHWFDPLALMHSFNIKDGKATYRSKFLESDVYKGNTSKGRIVYSGFGTQVAADPCKHMFQNFMSFFKPENQTSGDNCNVNMWPIGDKYYAITETTSMREIDPVTLNTGERLNTTDFVAIHTQTGHPHTDRDGTCYVLGTQFGRETNYVFYKIPKGGNFEDLKIVGKSPATNPLEPCYYHSFMITENWILLNETPMRLHVTDMVKVKAKGQGVGKAMQWHKDYDAIIHIINKHTGEPHPMSRKIKSKGYICFHHSNAYEEDGHIVIDCTPSWKQENVDYTIDRLRSADMMKDWLETNEKTNDAHRFCFPLDSEKRPLGTNLNTISNATAEMKTDGTMWITSEPLYNTTEEEWRNHVGPHGFEFCRINYANYNGIKHRYIWGNGFGTMLPDRILKCDTKTKEWTKWQEKETYPSEPVFVCRPGGTEEEDGVLLSVLIYSDKTKPIELLILDPKDLSEIARCKTEITEQPYAFHHTYFPMDFATKTRQPPNGQLAVN